MFMLIRILAFFGRTTRSCTSFHLCFDIPPFLSAIHLKITRKKCRMVLPKGGNIAFFTSQYLLLSLLPFTALTDDYFPDQEIKCEYEATVVYGNQLQQFVFSYNHMLNNHW